jgi:hypothetical protein
MCGPASHVGKLAGLALSASNAIRRRWSPSSRMCAPSPPIGHAIETLEVWRGRAPISTALRSRWADRRKRARLARVENRHCDTAADQRIKSNVFSTFVWLRWFAESTVGRVAGDLRGVGHKLAPLFRSDTSADVRSVLRACVSQDHDFAGSCLSLIVARSIGDQ